MQLLVCCALISNLAFDCSARSVFHFQQTNKMNTRIVMVYPYYKQLS
jgi:hypothetical protein